MKRYIACALCIIFLSCDDGNLEIETLDFDSITAVQNCGGVSVTTSNILFKINGDEALILELPAESIKNEVTTEDIAINVNESGSVIYRIFSGTVSSNYFCADVPPIEPVVTKEITAQDGIIYITTTTQDAVTYQHTIRLSGISLVTENESRITDLRINEFGTVTTTTP
ncbi:hypothetical protein [Maribacter cobaltidurans]|uniref:Uncharacterized protein n=1 Tax=Maribacter cobaltidurans TaxID=1178778 RepID=A0A223V0K0_9FLAO|nr:hypothetical protein [Maribacter cobaltidurans]ASV28945.1 hypothetical protein CJ263_01135 [Maribacter cobaltidurans]GGD73445.1 hypothetical protein GCM10011412_08900 [Maribacter cobaltidurans]